MRLYSNHAGNEKADKLARNLVYINNVLFDIQQPISLFKKEMLGKYLHTQGIDRGMAEIPDMQDDKNIVPKP